MRDPNSTTAMLGRVFEMFGKARAQARHCDAILEEIDATELPWPVASSTYADLAGKFYYHAAGRLVDCSARTFLWSAPKQNLKAMPSMRAGTLMSRGWAGPEQQERVERVIRVAKSELVFFWRAMLQHEQQRGGEGCGANCQCARLETRWTSRLRSPDEVIRYAEDIASINVALDRLEDEHAGEAIRKDVAQVGAAMKSEGEHD